MKKTFKRITLFCIACILIFSFVSCTTDSPNEQNEGQTPEAVDFVSNLKLDMNSDSLKIEATVHMFVDGDTTHFNVPSDIVDDGVLKARYLAINTPESTGKIEEYGKAASNFTRNALSSACSIILESDDSNLNLDSTGGRYLVWVWYKTEQNGEYRNLNLEILQNGLAIASSSANNRYGEVCMDAIAQAKQQKLNVYSGKPDPDFYYGDAIELTLKELRCNIESYNGIKVAFEGVITKNNANTVFIEEYDPETDMYYGISVYYGYGLSGEGLNILSVGNRSRIVGTVQYYEAGGTYQVSGLTYRQMKPNDPGNIQKISSGHSPAFPLTSPDTFVNGKVSIQSEDDIKTFDYAYLTMNTSLIMENLEVMSVYTTTDQESSSYGAMTLNCIVDGIEISVRTVVLLDGDGNLITADAFEGKTIDVKGLVDFFDGKYQIKVFSAKDITIKN